MKPDLGKLQPVDVRDVWPHEAHSFTTWLLENADYLSKVLGLDLELDEAEHKVGEFSLDLIGRDGSGRTVIVENQLERSDHDHLGKLLTYAAGTDAGVIIWVTPKFRENHRAAIDWLNERTDEDTNFFAVEVSALRIDDSKPAAVFQLVAQPNTWTKQVHAETSSATSARGAAYSAFWVELLARIRTQHPDWTTASAGSSLNWVTIPFGVSGLWYGLVFGQQGLRVELYFDSGNAEANLSRFVLFEAQRDSIDQRFGAPLEYDSLPGKQACRVHCTRLGWADVLNRDDWESQMGWFLTTLERLRPATQPHKAAVQGAN